MPHPNPRARVLRAAVVALALLPPSGAWGLSACPAFEEEAAAFPPRRIVALEGGASALERERARWDGELTLRAGVSGPVLHVRAPLGHDGVRDVWLTTESAPPANDTGDIGDTGDTGDTNDTGDTGGGA